MAGSILLNRVYVNTATAGTGTLTLGAVKSAAFCTIAEAGGANGQTFTFIIEEGNDFEIVQGVYGSAGPTLTRATVLISKIAGAVGTTKMTLAGAATVRVIAAKEDLTDASLLQSGTIAQARLGSGSGGAGLKALYDDQTFKTVTVPVAATQAQQEAGSSGTVFTAPSVQQYHPSAAKCWCKWGITTTIDTSYNVSSITDNGIGDWTVTINVDFSSANYAVVQTVEGQPFASGIAQVRNGGQAAGTLRLQACNDAGGTIDPAKNHVVVFGDQ